MKLLIVKAQSITNFLCLLANTLLGPCDGMTCGGHGRCRADRGRPLCDCFFGFRPSLNQTTCLSGKLSYLTDYYITINRKTAWWKILIPEKNLLFFSKL